MMVDCGFLRVEKKTGSEWTWHMQAGEQLDEAISHQPSTGRHYRDDTQGKVDPPQPAAEIAPKVGLMEG